MEPAAAEAERLAREERAAERVSAREERDAAIEAERLAREERAAERAAAIVTERLAREERARERAAAIEAERLAREERAAERAAAIVAEQLAREERAAERVSAREERAVERAATIEAERLAREERAAAAQKLYELLAASLGSAAGQRFPPPPAISAGPAPSGSAGGAGAPVGGAGGASAVGGASPADGSSPAGAGSTRSSTGANSPRSRAPPAGAREALVDAFTLAAPGVPPPSALPALPCPASEVQGVAFAHRLCSPFGGVAHSFLVPSDFSIVLSAEGVGVIQPASTSKPGMSFFLVTRESSAVVQAAHFFRGATQGGCQAFPLSTLPAALSLVVDAVQVKDAQSAPVLLHASLAPKQPMTSNDFLEALRQWRGVLPCALEGGAGAQDCLAGQGGEAARAGGCRWAGSLVAAAAAKLAAQAHPGAAAQPAGGSPGGAPAVD